MKWEYNEPHTTNLHSPVEYNVSYTHHQDRQCLFVLVLYRGVFVSHSNQTWRNSLGIWRNIGKIVSLSGEIIILEMKWYIGTWKRDTTKKSNTPKIEQKKIYEDAGDGHMLEYRNEEQESRERSKLMVELCEKPYYDAQF